MFNVLCLFVFLFCVKCGLSVEKEQRKKGDDQSLLKGTKKRAMISLLFGTKENE